MLTLCFRVLRETRLKFGPTMLAGCCICGVTSHSQQHSCQVELSTFYEANVPNYVSEKTVNSIKIVLACTKHILVEVSTFLVFRIITFNVFTAKILHYFDRSCSVQHDSAILQAKKC